MDGSGCENTNAGLLPGQWPVEGLDDDTSSGFYALIVRQGARVPRVPLGPERILYVGKASRSECICLHFDHADGTRSCPRRSLGALLRHELRLQVRPRSRTGSDQNWDDFRFNTEGEARLTHWLRTHLCVARLKRDGSNVDDELLAQFDPPLNLDGAPSPFRRLLLELRSECRREARSWAMERQ